MPESGNPSTVQEGVGREAATVQVCGPPSSCALYDTMADPVVGSGKMTCIEDVDAPTKREPTGA